MLARHVMHVEPRLRDDAVGVVELRFQRQMADVAGMDHEGRLVRQRIDLGDGLFERAERIRIGRLVEADMAVADLQEGEALALPAAASPMIPSEWGTPPATVHSTPVPTQVMHSSTLRRLTPSSRSESLIVDLL